MFHSHSSEEGPGHRFFLGRRPAPDESVEMGGESVGPRVLRARLNDPPTLDHVRLEPANHWRAEYTHGDRVVWGQPPIDTAPEVYLCPYAAGQRVAANSLFPSAPYNNAWPMPPSEPLSRLLPMPTPPPPGIAPPAHHHGPANNPHTTYYYSRYSIYTTTTYTSPSLTYVHVPPQGPTTATGRYIPRADQHNDVAREMVHPSRAEEYEEEEEEEEDASLFHDDDDEGLRDLEGDWLFEGQPEELKDLLCPISLTLLTRAVTAADGFSYNEPALQQYVLHRRQGNLPLTSPMTNCPMSCKTIPDFHTRRMVQGFIDRRRRERLEQQQQEMMTRANASRASQANGHDADTAQ